MHLMPLDTAKTVRRLTAGGFTEAQAEVLTYTLLDVAVEMRERAAARLRQQEAQQAHLAEVEAMRRATARLERTTKLWRQGFYLFLIVWAILMFSFL